MNAMPQMTGQGLHGVHSDQNPVTGQSGLSQGMACSKEPVQRRPPLLGVGLSQTRTRFLMPEQEDVQGDHGDQSDHLPFTGHGRSIPHSTSSAEGPSQRIPLSGCVHIRIRILFCNPQEAVQTDHGDQGVQMLVATQ